MRTALTLVLLISVILFSCKKEDELPGSIFDLKIKVEVTDTIGGDDLYFQEDEDIVFHVTITNPFDKTIGYYYDEVKCQEPTFGFNVYTYKDELVGNISPVEGYCPADLRYETIAPGEVKKMSRTWFQPIKDTAGKEVVNNKLPNGNYYVTYNMQLVDHFIDGRDAVAAKRPVADKIYFSVSQ